MPPRAANIRKLEGDKTLVALLDSCSAITQLVDAFKSVGANGHLSSSIIRSVAHKELHKYSELRTPYGTGIEKISLKGTEGELKVDALNPFALLWNASCISPYFSDLMRSGARRRPRLRLLFK